MSSLFIIVLSNIREKETIDNTIEDEAWQKLKMREMSRGVFCPPGKISVIPMFNRDIPR